MNWTRTEDKESVKCFTYLLLQKSTFIHTVLYRQLKLNVGKLKSVHINKLKKGKKKTKRKTQNESACTGLYSPPPSTELPNQISLC